MTRYQEGRILCMREQGVSYGQIASTLDVPLNTVKSFCRRRNICAETGGAEPRCAYCGKVMPQAGKRKKYCSYTCRMRWWNEHRQLITRKSAISVACRNCGRVFHAYAKAGRSYCSHRCYIAARFKGGDENE